MSDIEIGSVWQMKEDADFTCNVIEIDDFGVVRTDIPDRKTVGNKYDFAGGFSPKTFLKVFEPKVVKADMAKHPPHYKDTPKAVQILNEAVSIMAERGKSYDKSGGEAERSMPKIVAMFNALTGHELTPEQGWKFMCCLKLARSEQGEYREDNYLDGAAYMALAGEEAEVSSE